MDFSKLTEYEKDNYERICGIEKNMNSQEEFDEIHDFFIKMWDNYDYEKETRPVIVFTTPAQTGTCFFRLRVPLFNIWKNYADKYYIIFTDRFNINMMKFADLIIQHRAGDVHDFMTKVGNMWPEGHFKKPVICHDVDDNEWNLSDSHPLKEMWIKAGKDKMAKNQLAGAHKITTTGRILKRMFTEFNKHTNIEIVPNAFQWTNKQWKELSWKDKDDTKPEGIKNRPVVGYAGLTSHFPDLVKLLSVLKKVQDESDKDPYFILSGMPTEDRMTVPGPDGKPKQIRTPEHMTYKYRILNGFNINEKEKFDGFIPCLGKENCEGQDVKSLWNYGEFYDQYDINLAYLAEKSQFNKAKSAIKIIEGFKKGCVCVWTDWGGYEDFKYNLSLELKKVANLHMAARTDDEFAKHILFWLENPEYRKEIAEKFREYVTEAYDIEKINQNRIDIYDRLLKK